MEERTGMITINTYLVAGVLLVFVVVLLVVLVLCVCKLYHMRIKDQIPRYTQ